MVGCSGVVGTYPSGATFVNPGIFEPTPVVGLRLYTLPALVIPNKTESPVPALGSIKPANASPATPVVLNVEPFQ